VNPLKILLVDDEIDFMETLIKRLQKRGISVKGKNSGESALAELRENPVDVVVLDVKMPGMDGIETLREIKQMFPAIEVIMLSGHANIEIAIKGMELGAFDYLMKPTNIDELVFKLLDAAKKKQLHESQQH
jgi:DNA-binding NtrC family response regulator